MSLEITSRRAGEAVRHPGGILSIVLLTVGIVVGAVLLESHDPAPLHQHEEPTSDAVGRPPEVVESERLIHAASRQGAVWVPDGNVWVRLTHEGDPIAGAVHVHVSNSEARSFPTATSDSLLADADGWCVVPSRVFGSVHPHVLVLTLRGFLPHVLANPMPEIQHVVELQRPLRAFATLREMPHGRPVVGARMRASLRLFDGEPWEQESIPGGDEGRAIYYGVSNGQGIVELAVGKASGDYFYEVEHQWCLPALGAPAQIALGQAHVAVDMVMPMVGAIAYSGDRMLHGSLLVDHAPPTDRRTTQRLESIRQSMARGVSSILTTAFVPDIRSPRPIAAQSVAEFAKSDRRVDRVPLVRLDEYRGPLEIMLTGTGREARSAMVRLLAPPKFAGELEADFRLLISGGTGFPPRVAKFGDSVELPRGKYRVYGQTDGNRRALADDLLVVESPEPVDFVGRWRDGVFCHVLAIKSAGQPNRATVVYSRDGVNYPLTSGVRANGDLVIWHPQILGRVRVHSPGCKQAEATFQPVPGTRMVRAECTLIDL